MRYELSDTELDVLDLIDAGFGTSRELIISETESSSWREIKKVATRLCRIGLIQNPNELPWQLTDTGETVAHLAAAKAQPEPEPVAE